MRIGVFEHRPADAAFHEKSTLASHTFMTGIVVNAFKKLNV